MRGEDHKIHKSRLFASDTRHLLLSKIQPNPIGLGCIKATLKNR